MDLTLELISRTSALAGAPLRWVDEWIAAGGIENARSAVDQAARQARIRGALDAAGAEINLRRPA